MRETLELLSLSVEIDEYEYSIYRNSDGQYHRLHGPAIMNNSGVWRWYWCGLCHRVGGPASQIGMHWLFDKYFDKEAYEIECADKTMPQWKEYDEYIRSCNF